jgi:hypothetical protein
MTLRKSPTTIPACVAPGLSPAPAALKRGARFRLDANRRNPQKSTGSHTARGKAQSRLNGPRSPVPAGRVRSGSYARFHLNLVRTLLKSSPCAVNGTAGAALTPDEASHRLFAVAAEIARQAEIAVAENLRRGRTWQESRKKNSFFSRCKA